MAASRRRLAAPAAIALCLGIEVGLARYLSLKVFETAYAVFQGPVRLR
jgi:hypothetical protein